LTYSVLGGLVEQGRVSWDTETKLFYVSNADKTVQSLAEEGLQQIEDAILELLENNPKGLRNVEIADMLNLHSSVLGGRRNYLTYSILGGLLADGRVVRDEKSRTYTKA
jgi:DNA-binding IclR family transcriptional regulator